MNDEFLFRIFPEMKWGKHREKVFFRNIFISDEKDISFLQ